MALTEQYQSVPCCAALTVADAERGGARVLDALRQPQLRKAWIMLSCGAGDGKPHRTSGNHRGSAESHSMPGAQAWCAWLSARRWAPPGPAQVKQQCVAHAA